MSFSLANSQAPCPFHAYGWRPGIIASAAAVEECALCSWARDGHTMRRVCDVNQPRCACTTNYEMITYSVMGWH